MAAAAGPATPNRPLPGAFLNTPAGPPPPGPTIFAGNASTLGQNRAIPQPQADAPGSTGSSAQKTPIEHGAVSIVSALAHERKFPDLETYLTHGVSDTYELPKTPAWLPFQKLKTYDLPPRLLEQANHSGMGMQMGIFAPLSHAWVALDNCLYLWDYTQPNPEIIGFEENTQPITAVKLVPPKPGVFIADIKHMIVVCTASDMILLGVAVQSTSTGAPTIALYNTRMTIPVKGVGVGYIVASQTTGRIFFSGSLSDDIFEFHYQQEEGWFRGKCNRICHTKTTMNFVSENIQAVGQFFGPNASRKALCQLVIDDSRNLLYSLSNTNEIKVWLVKDRLEPALTRPLASLLQNTGHFSGRTELLTRKDVRLCSLSVVPATEARRLTLVATSSTGCRLYLSVTRGYGYHADAQNPPSTMQILHIRFPPRDPNVPPTQTQPGQIDNTSSFLSPVDMAYRFSPGYWLAFQQQGDESNPKSRMFCVAPDMGRLSNSSDTSLPNAKFSEFGQWIDLPAEMQQVVPMTAEFGATGEPAGFGNELAVQFDSPSSEFAIVTTTGIQIIRRRRLVDIFAAMVKYGSSDEEGVEGDVKRFIRNYGRAETAATSLAVACGQGVDVADNRVAQITDPEVIERARKAYIEHGGQPEYSTNADIGSGNPTDNTRPSPRHDGTALYISRIVRSIWGAKIIKDTAGSKLAPTIEPDRLRSIQRDLASLKEFLDRNRSFIEGLAGPQALARVTTAQQELALQGENQFMWGLVRLISSISEGISFVLVLFDERIEEILALLSDDGKEKAKQLTFETLFISASGRELAKDLVKAIVNRNIANGSNVDTVAEALRRRCGSFCSADDVVIFKAQEQVKRAGEAGAQTESGRVLLNESVRLFQKVASSLSFENLEKAIKDYIGMAFYAGAIQLCLTVAFEKDRSRRALAWMRDGKPDGDARQDAYQTREKCYWLVSQVITSLDNATASVPEAVDGKYTLATKRRNEAYDIVNSSDDVVFLTYLYDWYVQQNQAERLLEIDSSYVVDYLKNRAENSRPHVDLLWRYFAHHHDYLQAAEVQLTVARSGFEDLSLEDRIGYLSRARTNASTRQTIITDSRQSKQKVLREASDLLEIASIQDEIMQRIKGETRMPDDARPLWIARLNGNILPVEELFNQFADPAGYHDICIFLYQVADHRNPADIKQSWQAMIDQTNAEAPALFGRARRPWEAVGERVRELGRRLHVSPATFPIQVLYPMLEIYAAKAPREYNIPLQWATDVFLDLEIPHETLLPVQEQLYYSNDHPFAGSKRKNIASRMVYLLARWWEASERSGERVLFGSEENLSVVQDCLASLLRSEMEQQWRAEAESLAARIKHAMR